MAMLGRVVEQCVGTFEVYSRDAIVRNLDVLEPNWKWSVPSDSSGDYSFKFSKQPLQSTSIISAEHSGALEGVAKHDLPRVSIIFVLAGEIEVNHRRMQKRLRIPANSVASITDRNGKRLDIKPRSSWLVFQIPEPVLRQHFEELTGKPYVQEFSLSPVSFRQGGAQGLYQTLRQAEKDLMTARPAERVMLAKAYSELLLVKLFAKLPHNLTDAFSRGTLEDAPRQLLRAEAFMRDNLHNSIMLEDLANAASCSARALQRMFKTYRGDTPMGILCNYRLAAAHGAIKGGQAESITDLAMSLQFSNPGRFSVLYKHAYGFSPSSILRFTREHSDDARTA
ncbi:transcriptional regulator [Rhizobium sp. AC27/96]|uniref:helix-turn-helix transcriptional regulator n=1 Tax=Rhizobium sp. AC27/96 TaxID=1841653 RepID=UPI0008278635|nr:AraC family transcriptional regulator [Rhizobium sp. AC27/96]NTF45635.1 helix-turn-helix transcriptional regulator [Rhizobium rhizogenes]OCJ07062.1 transcriptional regulator [Rhizobium sp. AC27/96]